MIDPICIGIGALWALVAIVLYFKWHHHGYWENEHEDIIIDGGDPAEIHELNCIIEQRKNGRERGGQIVIVNQSEKDGEK